MSESEVGESRAPDSVTLIKATERELITGVFFDKDGTRHEYAYTAIGFAYERVERMLNPGRPTRNRRWE